MSGVYRPQAWYRRTADTFNENVRIEAGVESIEVAKTLNDVVKRVTNTHSAAVWFDNKLLAVIQYEQGAVFVRIVPSMRDHIALPWRAYG
jgi:signal transduction histidine kinase